MAAYLIRRLWQMVPTLFGVVLLVFFLFKYFGGDPAEILGGLNATPEQIAAIRQQLGLDQSVWVQLGIYFKSILSFDWGKSWATNESVANLFASRLPATLTVMLPILILDVVIALPIAMWVAYRRGSLADRSIMVITTVALSISFLVYIIIGQYLFGFQLGWFPVQGWSDSVWLALFYGGLVRKKNVLSVLAQCMGIAGLDETEETRPALIAAPPGGQPLCRANRCPD